jgi:hypothetical protein
VKHVCKTLNQNQKKTDGHNQVKGSRGNFEGSGTPGKHKSVSYKHDAGDKKHEYRYDGEYIVKYRQSFLSLRVFKSQHINTNIRPLPCYHVDGKKDNPYVNIRAEFLRPEDTVKKQITPGDLGQVYHQQDNREHSDDKLENSINPPVQGI